MRRIAVSNQKGGVGKTTTTANLAAAMAEGGRRVLLVDLDPQAHLTMHFGVEPADSEPSLYDVLVESAPAAGILRRISPNLAVLPSHTDLAVAETRLVTVVGREVILREALSPLAGDFDVMLIDCPPSLSLLTINALVAADEVLIPLQAHFFGLQGLSKLLETVTVVRQRINPRLRVSGIVLCMYDAGTKLAGEVVDDLTNFLAAARGTDNVCADARLFETRIRRNIKLAEAPSHGRTVLDYDPASHGAVDYRGLAAEVLAADGIAAAAPSTIPVAPKAKPAPVPSAPAVVAMPTVMSPSPARDKQRAVPADAVMATKPSPPVPKTASPKPKPEPKAKPKPQPASVHPTPVPSTAEEVADRIGKRSHHREPNPPAAPPVTVPTSTSKVAASSQPAATKQNGTASAPVNSKLRVREGEPPREPRPVRRGPKARQEPRPSTDLTNDVERTTSDAAPRAQSAASPPPPAPPVPAAVRRKPPAKAPKPAAPATPSILAAADKPAATVRTPAADAMNPAAPAPPIVPDHAAKPAIARSPVVPASPAERKVAGAS